MNKIWIVTYKRSDSEYTLNVLGKTIIKAVQDAERYLKKNYYSWEIVSIELNCNVHVAYKS